MRIEPKRPAPVTSITWRDGHGLRVTVHLPDHNVVVGVRRLGPWDSTSGGEEILVLYRQDAGGWLGIDDTGQELSGTNLPDLVRRAFTALGVAAPADALTFAAEGKYVLGN